MSIIFLRSVLLYALVIFAVRFMGKRQIGELQPSELVITILVSNIATLPIEDTTIPMITGVIPILVLVSLDVMMSGATLKFRRLRRIISGSPKIIVRDGVIDQKQMKDLRFSVDDLMESLHEYQIFDVSEVQFAIVETTGKISVYQKFPNRSLTPEMVQLQGKSQDPPSIIISDGVLIENALPAAKVGQGWVESVLKEKQLRLAEVFLMTVSADGTYQVIEKEQGTAKQKTGKAVRKA